MKIICLFLFLFGFAVPGRAQITIDRNDMPNVGDTLRTSVTSNATGLDYSITGNNFTWDFSSLDWVSQHVDTFRAVSTVPFAYQLVFNNPFDPNKATIASPQGSPDSLAGVTLQDVFTFYRETNTNYSFLGMGVTLNGITIPIKYNNPDLLYTFPLTVGATDSSTAVFSFSLAGYGHLYTSRHRVNQVDGWGTVTTPFGTFPTVRVKSVVFEYDSLYVDSLATGYPLYRYFTEYKWLSDNKGLPVVEFIEEGPVVRVIYQDSVRSDPAVGQHAVSGTVKYHNLAEDPLGPVLVFLSDSTGTPVSSVVTDAYGTFSFPSLPDGTYTLVATSPLPWGGGNATDALLILKHFTGMQPLSGMDLIVSDVDDSQYTNAVDALLVAKRFVGQVLSFPSGDWYFENKQIQVNGQDVTVIIRGQCYGDVNGSYE